MPSSLAEMPQNLCWALAALGELWVSGWGEGSAGGCPTPNWMGPGPEMGQDGSGLASRWLGEQQAQPSRGAPGQGLQVGCKETPALPPCCCSPGPLGRKRKR